MPKMIITCVREDKETGESYFQDVHIPVKDKGEIGALAEKIGSNNIIFRTTNGQYDYDWHNAPQRQFVINLKGDGCQITVKKGEINVKEFQPGDVFFLEDTNGTGHKTKAIKGIERTSVFITVPDSVIITDQGEFQNGYE